MADVYRVVQHQREMGDAVFALVSTQKQSIPEEISARIPCSLVDPIFGISFIIASVRTCKVQSLFQSTSTTLIR